MERKNSKVHADEVPLSEKQIGQTQQASGEWDLPKALRPTANWCSVLPGKPTAANLLGWMRATMVMSPQM
ncbi:hypothetical protein ANTRET_LOCUS7389 [Anthophora retusa]